MDFIDFHRIDKKKDSFGFHSFTLLSYDYYEDLCGQRKRHSDFDEVTTFETKRYRLVKKNAEKSYCVIA